MNIYVGNIPHSTTEQQLIDLFTPYGSVTSAKIITDQFTGASRGFAFIDMGQNDGASAIEQLNGSDLGGRSLVVNEARPRTEGGNRSSNGSSGYSRGNSGGSSRW
jgi:RNA recognition motif-containing protein